MAASIRKSVRQYNVSIFLRRIYFIYHSFLLFIPSYICIGCFFDIQLSKKQKCPISLYLYNRSDMSDVRRFCLVKLKPNITCPAPFFVPGSLFVYTRLNDTPDAGRDRLQKTKMGCHNQYRLFLLVPYMQPGLPFFDFAYKCDPLLFRIYLAFSPCVFEDD